MQNLWSVLHAVNKVWEPDYKWTTPEGLDLATKPERLSERLNRVFSLEDPEDGIRTAFQLILDVLDLVPSCVDVSATRAPIEAGMQGESR